MSAVTELLATLALVLPAAWTAWLIAVRVLRDATASVRACAAAIVGYWSLVGTFFALASVGLFRVSIAVPLWVAVAVALHLHGRLGRDALVQLRCACRRVGAGWAEWRQTRYGLVLVLALGAILVMRGVRSMLAPPLTWDALTYHLLKAGRWVQTGGFVPERAPDAWGYYEYFQPFGDYLWAWAMLPVHGDLLIGPAGVLVWATCLLGVYTLARTLGVSGNLAVLASLFVAFNPSVLNYLTTSHVENLLLAVFVLAAVFIARSFAQRDPANLVLAAAALGVLAGVKFNGAPIAVLGMAAIAVAMLRWRGTARAGVGTVAACLAAFAPGCQPYVRAWYETGSPAYPFTVAIGGVTLLEGNRELSWLMARSDRARGPLFEQLFVPDQFNLIVGREQFLNPGPTALVIALAGLVGAIVALRQRERRPVAIFLIGATLVTIAGVATSDVAALRTLWVPVFGRFLLVAITTATLFTAMLAPRISVPVLVACAAVNVPLIIPLGWGPTDMTALAELRVAVVSAAAVVGLGAAGFALHRRWPLTPLMPPIAIGLITAGALVIMWTEIRVVRDAYRHAYFRAAGEERVYDPHRLAHYEASAFPLWRQLDTGSGLVIATSAGWNTYGHNWFRYPFMGSRLQNRVVYVPITEDGSIVDYRDEDVIDARASYRAWLGRLVDARVDYVVLLPPEPPEAAWVQAHPEIFTSAGAGSRRLAKAYRLNRASASAQLTGHLAAR